MSSEFFMRVPTFLELHSVPEIQSQAPLLGATKTGDKRIDYVSDYFAIAKKVGEKFNFNPIIILSQGSVESGWGTSQLARENHNFFGVTAFGKPNPFWDGTYRVSSSSGLKFRNYKSVEDGFSDYARMITAYYPAAAKVSFDPVAYATAIASSPYINEKNGDNRAKYRALIIQSAQTIMDVAKKKFPKLLV
jgi:flagellar protein FlgJ